MKNLKKVLSLVLALAMAMSLMTAAFAADTGFVDKNEINNTEAVEVMTALGVIQGNTKGEFDPQGNLTRETAAKIICYMLLGEKNAEALTVAGAPFDDVAATRWSAPFIAYCAEQGIIAGNGAGKFYPTAELTSLQFAKMCLIALGYDAEIEKLTGESWGIKASSLAVLAGLNKDLGNLSDTIMTREAAAQMAYNLLTADMVRYTNKGTNITMSDGTSVVVGASDATKMPSGANDYDPNNLGKDTSNSVMQFCELYFDKLKMVTGDTDDFGRPASYKWQLDNKDVYNALETATFTFTAATSDKDIVKQLKGYIFNGNKLVDANSTASADIESSDIDGLPAKIDSGDKLAAEVAGWTANGMLIEVFTDKDKNVTNVVEVKYTVQEVTKVSTDKKTGDVTYTLSGSGNTGVVYADKDQDNTIVFAGAAPEKGDIVTCVKANSVLYVYPTTSFDGTQTATKTDSNSVQTITVSGTAYTVGSATLASKNTFNNSKDAATYYVDQYGYIVATDSKATASTDYAYVLATQAKVDSSAVAATAVSLQAKVLKADGTIAVYDVAITKDSGNYYIKNVGSSSNLIYDKTKNSNAGSNESEVNTAADTALDSKVFGYTLDGNTITFESITTLASGSTTDNTVYTVAVGAARDYIAYNNTSYTVNSDQTVLVNSATKFVAYNSTDDEATVYTGVSSLPKSVDSSQTGHAVLKTGTTDKVGTASVVFFTISVALTADATDDYVYVDGSYTTVMIDGKDKYQYTGYKADGTTVNLMSTSKTLTAGLYAPNADNEISGSPKTNSDNSLIIDNAALTVENDMVKSGSDWYNITKDTQIVYVDSDLDEVNGNKGTLILVKDTKNVDVIYVTATV